MGVFYLVAYQQVVGWFFPSNNLTCLRLLFLSFVFSHFKRAHKLDFGFTQYPGSSACFVLTAELYRAIRENGDSYLKLTGTSHFLVCAEPSKQHES